MILMIHRVDFNDYKIDEIYYQRNLVININKLIKLLDEFLDSRFKFGTIEQSIESNNYLHLTFDDGYKEHLIVAKEIKKVFELQKGECSFAINIGNSLLSDFTGMDLIYDIIQNNSLNELCNYLSINLIKCTIELIKEKYIKMSLDDIKNIKESFSFNREKLENQFLNEKEIIELSKLFNIVSHGLYHRDLTYNKEFSRSEIINSKIRLEKLCKEPIETFCYPEGKSDEDIWQMCKDAKYKYGLSITHTPNNPYKIGRYCINNKIDELTRILNDK